MSHKIHNVYGIHNSLSDLSFSGQRNRASGFEVPFPLHVHICDIYGACVDELEIGIGQYEKCVKGGGIAYPVIAFCVYSTGEGAYIWRLGLIAGSGLYRFF